MEKIKIPAFNEADCIENRESKKAIVWTLKNTDEKSYFSYCELFENNGFLKKEESMFISGDQLVYT